MLPFNLEKSSPFDLLERKKPAISLAYGFPPFGIPPNLAGQACAAINSGANSYTSPAGDPIFRAELQRAAASETRGAVPLPIICTGAGAGIACALFALFCDGGDLIVVDPFFVQHVEVATLAGAQLRHVKALASFRLPVRALTSSLTKNTRAILLCTPNNPTGVVYSIEDLRAVCIAAEENGTFVLIDEIYRDFIHSGCDGVAPSLLGVSSNVIVVRGVSKNLGAAGWRVGYVFANADISSKIIHYHKMLYTCAPTPFQIALRHSVPRASEADRRLIATNARLVYDALKVHYEMAPPQGGFFMFPRAPGTLTGTDVFGLCLERGLGVLPGCVFSGEDTHFRISYAVSQEDLLAACDILTNVAQEFA